MNDLPDMKALVAPFEAQADDAFPALDMSCLQKTSLKIITCTIEGIVEPEDMARLLEAPVAPGGASVGDLSKIREKHHAVARLMASGMTQRLAASISGYTENYISILLNNPSMQELIAYYRASHVNAAETIGHRLRNLSMEAIESLADDLTSGALEPNEKLQLAKLGLDRSGHGPQSKHTHVSENHLFDHAELQRLNRAARADSKEDIIDLKALPAPSTETEE